MFAQTALQAGSACKESPSRITRKRHQRGIRKGHQGGNPREEPRGTPRGYLRGTPARNARKERPQGTPARNARKERQQGTPARNASKERQQGTPTRADFQRQSSDKKRPQKKYIRKPAGKSKRGGLPRSTVLRAFSAERMVSVFLCFLLRIVCAIPARHDGTGQADRRSKWRGGSGRFRRAESRDGEAAHFTGAASAGCVTDFGAGGQSPLSAIRRRTAARSGMAGMAPRFSTHREAAAFPKRAKDWKSSNVI